MVMQRIDFPSSRGFCKTDRGLVEADYNMCELPLKPGLAHLPGG